MFRLGHYGMALLVYSVIGLALLVRGYRDDALAGGVVMLLFTMHPDMDGDFSFIPHREITHTVWFAVLVGLGCALIILAEGLYRGRDRTDLTWPVTWAFSLGTLSGLTHLFADMLNPWGVMPFYPLSNVLITFDLVKASNVHANVGLFVAGILASVAAWHVGTARAPETAGDARPASPRPAGSIRAALRRLFPNDPDR